MTDYFVVDKDIENLLPQDTLAFDGRVRIGSRAKISVGTRIEPPVLVASGARILDGVSIGKYSYVGRNTIVTRADIGCFCSIAHDCQINYFRGHPMDWLSTHTFQYDRDNFAFWSGYSGFTKQHFDGDTTQAKVVIGADVWLGAGVYIFGGVTIGSGAIIGARAMVQRDIPAYGVAVGAPAKVKNYRFDQKLIEKLLAIEWWTLDESLLRDLPFYDVNRCLELLDERTLNSKSSPGI